MKTLRTIGAVITLTFVFSLSAFAGETPTPPCATEPGQIETPPCFAAQAPTPGEIDTPPAAKAPDLTDIAANVLESMWLLF